MNTLKLSAWIFLGLISLGLLSPKKLCAQREGASDSVEENKRDELKDLFQKGSAELLGSNRYHDLRDQFLTKSRVFVDQFPDNAPVWLLRTMVGLELNNKEVASEGGNRLLELGVGNSRNALVYKVFYELSIRRWLGSCPPGRSFFVPGFNSAMIWVPPGSFVMGCLSEEKSAISDKNIDTVDEGPLTTVKLTEGFWLGETEVTLWDYGVFLRESRSESDNLDIYRHFPFDPKEISWTDAIAFCEWLNRRERNAGRLPDGYRYTLPTEAQWEYACRAGASTGIIGTQEDMTWHINNSGMQVHKVASKQANAWGFFDMYGNLEEWCLDWYAESLQGGTIVDPQGPRTGTMRVLRGGSCRDPASVCRPSCRFRFEPNESSNAGFRLALSTQRT